MRLKTLVIILLVVSACISVINPIYPEEMYLQHAGTLCILGILAADVKWKLFSFKAFAAISLFCLIHIIGARWIYSFVPYDEWSKAIFGWSPGDHFGFERNHFDRFVHFAYGVLLFPAIFEIVRRNVTARWAGVVFISWLCVHSISLFYELFEWSLTMIFAPDYAESYNGQQGDIWDAQKDMALAMAGSTIMAVVFMVWPQKSKP